MNNSLRQPTASELKQMKSSMGLDELEEIKKKQGNIPGNLIHSNSYMASAWQKMLISKHHWIFRISNDYSTCISLMEIYCQIKEEWLHNKFSYNFIHKRSCSIMFGFFNLSVTPFLYCSVLDSCALQSQVLTACVLYASIGGSQSYQQLAEASGAFPKSRKVHSRLNLYPKDTWRLTYKNVLHGKFNLDQFILKVYDARFHFDPCS